MELDIRNLSRTELPTGTRSIEIRNSPDQTHSLAGVYPEGSPAPPYAAIQSKSGQKTYYVSSTCKIMGGAGLVIISVHAWIANRSSFPACIMIANYVVEFLPSLHQLHSNENHGDNWKVWSKVISGFGLPLIFFLPASMCQIIVSRVGGWFVQLLKSMSELTTVVLQKNFAVCIAPGPSWKHIIRTLLHAIMGEGWRVTGKGWQVKGDGWWVKGDG
jgi:hypothetical protein